jgi:phenylalanyl-tRNA synthetase beta chain
MHPQNSFDITVDGTKIGYLSVPHPVVIENIDKKCAVAFFEIETAAFASVNAGSTKYSEPSKFPAIDIDLTFNVDLGAVNFEQLSAVAAAASGSLLGDVRVKDIYTDEQGSALTLRFSFVSAEKTLSKQELSPLTDAIIAEFAKLGIEMKA